MHRRGYVQSGPVVRQRSGDTIKNTAAHSNMVPLSRETQSEHQHRRNHEWLSAGRRLLLFRESYILFELTGVDNMHRAEWASRSGKFFS